MINVSIGDGSISGDKAKVIDGALRVSAAISAIPEQGEASKLRFLSGLLGSTGLDSGTTNMNVDGSVTTQEFYISSNVDYDIRVTKILIYIQDTTISHPGYGALSALANGIDLVAIEGGVETKILDGAKKMSDLIQQTFMDSPFGDAAKAFELEQVEGTNDALLLPMDIGSIIPGGIRIGRGTKDKIVFRVNDDTTGLVFHTLRVVGYRHYA